MREAMREPAVLSFFFVCLVEKELVYANDEGDDDDDDDVAGEEIVPIFDIHTAIRRFLGS